MVKLIGACLQSGIIIKIMYQAGFKGLLPIAC